MHLIDNQEEFNKVCIRLQQESVVFMDTEFYRRKTYYAKLSVVQIATQNDRIILDMLACKDYRELKQILFDDKILKVFHAPDQDFDIFYNIFGKLPQNIFDTQIAAGVIGMNSIMGYAKLCKAMLNIDLDKTMQTANWLERPLKKSLLEYAIKDVDYLIPLYRNLSKEISDRKLWDTYKARSKKLLAAESYKFNPEKQLKRMPLYNKTEQFRQNLIHFIALREQCAIKNDIPRNFCASDSELILLCEKLPKKEADLYKIGVVGKAIAKGVFKDKLLDLCNGLSSDI